MVLKKIYQATEGTVFVEAESLCFDGVLEGENSKDYEKSRILPEKLLDEVRSFVKRNSLAVVACEVGERRQIHCCCPRCLKAHLIKKCDKLGLIEYKQRLSRIFKCKTGHDGYYLDGSKLFKN